jgi:type VI protein secretion system component VasK
MNSYTLPVIFLCLADVVFWLKGNSKALYGFDWSPFKWWLYTSLLTNYMTLYAWWKLIELGDVWRA